MYREEDGNTCEIEEKLVLVRLFRNAVGAVIKTRNSHGTEGSRGDALARQRESILSDQKKKRIDKMCRMLRLFSLTGRAHFSPPSTAAARPRPLNSTSSEVEQVPGGL